MLTSLHKMLDTCLTWLLISLMIILTVVVMVAVFYRRFGSSLVWYDEVASVLMAWITYYGAALAALRRQHIGFDGVLMRLPVTLRLVMVVIAEAAVIGFLRLARVDRHSSAGVIGDKSSSQLAMGSGDAHPIGHPDQRGAVHHLRNA